LPFGIQHVTRGVFGYYNLHQLSITEIKPWIEKDAEEVFFYRRLMEDF